MEEDAVIWETDAKITVADLGAREDLLACWEAEATEAVVVVAARE